MAASALGIIVGKVADIQILLLLAAIIAGTPNALKAFRALRVPTFSIELLVTIASIGAIIVGNYWEAAAVALRSCNPARWSAFRHDKHGARNAGSRRFRAPGHRNRHVVTGPAQGDDRGRIRRNLCKTRIPNNDA